MSRSSDVRHSGLSAVPAEPETTAHALLQALRESEARYHSVFETSRDPIYITERDGRFIDVNASLLELFGYKREELLSLNARVLYADPIDRLRFQREIEQHPRRARLRCAAAREGFPIDTLKIDRSFISNLDEEGSSLELIETIIALSQILGLEAVAEGVETPEQLETVRRLGSSFAQGYGISVPLPADRAEQLIRDNRR